MGTLKAERRRNRPEADGIKQVGRVDLQQLVTFTLECQHSVRPQPHVAIHTWSEMNSEEWKVWVGHLKHTHTHTNTFSINKLYNVMVVSNHGI